MNARALSADVLLGIAPIAMLIALWQALVSFGYAPVSLLPPPTLTYSCGPACAHRPAGRSTIQALLLIRMRIDCFGNKM